MLGEDWKDGLDPWQVELAEALDDMVTELGRIPTTDASYTDYSPYQQKGQNCQNCVAMDEAGCQWVAVSCAPTGWCKFNIVPVLIRASAEVDSYYKSMESKKDNQSEDDSSSEDDEYGDDMDDINKDGEGGAVAAGSNGGIAASNGPTVEGVHIDTPVWTTEKDDMAGGKARKRGKRVNPLLNVDDLPVETQERVMAKSETVAETIGALQKNSELRYTLAPWYVPNKQDAHGEWTDPEELQKALWGYVKSGDRDIRLQHNVEVVAGEWVEAMTWPHEVEVPMLKADTNEIYKQTFPAGTVFLGVQWEPWAWDLVKKGMIRGFSIGGTGAGVEVDLPTEYDNPATFPHYNN
jgi:Putative phage serine protease XkdF